MDTEQTLGQIMAEAMAPATEVGRERLKCPECGSLAYVTVSAYPSAEVVVTTMGDGSKRVHYGRLSTTLKEIKAEVEQHYGEGPMDVRDEIHCSDCNWWTYPNAIMYGKDGEG